MITVTEKPVYFSKLSNCKPLRNWKGCKIYYVTISISNRGKILGLKARSLTQSLLCILRYKTQEKVSSCAISFQKSHQTMT